MRAVPSGWSTSSERRNDGAIDSEQRTAAPEPVVEASEQGAGELGALYWREVERFMRGLVATNVNADGSVQLRLRRPGHSSPRRPSGRSRTMACAVRTHRQRLSCTAGGTISFSQETPPLALASAITGFFPRLAAPPGRPGWTGALYEQVQRRLHQAISKRYFHALLARERV